MMFNYTFINISVISWQSVLLVEETGVPGENHRPVASNWQSLLHISWLIVVSCSIMPIIHNPSVTYWYLPLITHHLKENFSVLIYNSSQIWLMPWGLKDRYYLHLYITFCWIRKLFCTFLIIYWNSKRKKTWFYVMILFCDLPTSRKIWVIICCYNNS